MSIIMQGLTVTSLLFYGCFEVVKPQFYVFVCLFVVMFSHEKPQARKSNAKKRGKTVRDRERVLPSPHCQAITTKA